MWKQFRTPLLMLLVLTLLTGIVYPLVVTAVAHVAFSHQANGSLLLVDGKVVGSELIGQAFSRPEYFWGRLSATLPFPYNAAGSSGSNFGPMNPALVKNAKARMDALRRYDVRIQSIPVDLVTSSASGLDPHISPAAAQVQVNRVAAARKMTTKQVEELVQQHTDGRQFRILGEPRVNVLELNLALDVAQKP
jgi:K+-transporting ATPase ATPase C chain